MIKSNYYLDKLNAVKAEMRRAIESAITNAEGFFLAFPTSYDEDEDKVFINAHLDTSGNTEPCLVGSVCLTDGNFVVNLSDNFCGHWTLALTELSAEDLQKIIESLEKSGYLS
jgi:hypothetical protein